MKTKGTTLIILILLVILLFGVYIAADKFVFPSLINRAVNRGINTSVQQLKNIDFSNAENISINQTFNSSNLSLQISISKGILSLERGVIGKKVSGEIRYLGAKPKINRKSGVLEIKSNDQAGVKVFLQLPPDLPTSLNIVTGAGLTEIDLSGLDVPMINVVTGAGEVNIKLSEKHPVNASLKAGAGVINLFVPKNVGHRVILPQGFSNIRLGANYERTSIGFQSKNYNTSSVKSNITIGQAAGGFNIEIIE